MSDSNLVRWGALAAMLGGVASVMEFIVYPTNPGLAEVLLLAAYVLAAVGLVGFHAVQKGSYGRLGRGGLYTASVGSLGAILAMTVSVVGNASLDVLHAIGASLMIIGYILYGVATLQARVLPRWCGVMFSVVGPVAFVVLGFGGYTTIVFGLFWLILGYALWSWRGASVRQTTAVI